MMRRTNSCTGTRKAFLLSLGCAKNRVDGERFAAVLVEAGYELVTEAEGADVCCVNTCGFLRSAVEENLESIFALEELKKKGSVSKIGVVGCLVNRYGDELRDNLPLVDFWARCEDYDSLREALGCQPLGQEPKRRRLGQHPKHSRYLKLAEGCSNNCAYCAIPVIRGEQRSRRTRDIVEEAEGLVLQGAKEICLVAQDLAAYGADLGGGENLISLFDALEGALPDDVWLRALYLHPSHIGRSLLERVAAGKQLLPYLDIPIQHASPLVLAAMGRSVRPEELLGVFQTAREIRGDFALRTTCMVGFPGETRADFEELLRFMELVRFDRVGVFTFSPEEGTPAQTMDSQVPDRTKKRRAAKLMEQAEAISCERQGLFVGKTLRVLVDEVLDDVTLARSFREAPDVDGVIELQPLSAGGLQVGDWATVRILEAHAHDLIAIEVDGESCNEETSCP